MSEDVLHKFIECFVPVTACNLRCHYCYVAQGKDPSGGKLPEAEFSAEHLARAFDKNRLGGTCLVNLCGAGETLLPPEIPGYVKAILSQGHFVMIVTNMLLGKPLDEILSITEEWRSRLFFKCSFHYLQLKQRGLLECFCENVEKVRAVGCSMSIEITPSDELVPHIEELCRFSLEHFGALPHVTVARNESLKNTTDLPRWTQYSLEEYEKIWGVFSSELFRFKNSVWDAKVEDFCNAGRWSLVLDLYTGKSRPCYRAEALPNFYDVSKPFPGETAVGRRCREPHCYNGHAFLTLGLVPSIQTPTYAEMRDRECSDGSHWLTPRMRAFFSQKLYDNNPRDFEREQKEMTQ